MTRYFPMFMLMAFFALSGCQTQSADGKGHIKITRQESLLNFSLPNAVMDTEYYKQPFNSNRGVTYVVSSSAKDGFTHAVFWYSILSRTNWYFTKKVDLVEYVNGRSFGENSAVSMGDKGSIIKLGNRFYYQLFSVNDNQCTAITGILKKSRGGMNDGGRSRLYGHYCNQTKTPMREEDIVRLVTSITINEYADKSKASMQANNLYDRYKSISGYINNQPLELVVNEFDKPNTGDIKFTFSLPQKSSNCTAQWKVSNKHTNKKNKKLKTGTWSYLCTNGMAGKGIIQDYDNHVSIGIGINTDNSKVTFHFGDEHMPKQVITAFPEIIICLASLNFHKIMTNAWDEAKIMQDYVREATFRNLSVPECQKKLTDFTVNDLDLNNLL